MSIVSSALTENFDNSKILADRFAVSGIAFGKEKPACLIIITFFK